MDENINDLEKEPKKIESTEDEAPAVEYNAPEKKEKTKRKMKRSDKIIIAIFNPLLALVIAFLVVCLPYIKEESVIFKKEAVYGNVFVAALGDKYERLLAADSEKIVVVGGSSVAFGLDSKLMEEKTGIPVVNFGLYAALGTKLMLDLSLPHINEGDTVVIAPELDAQTLSLYFNASTTLRALDGKGR